MCQTANTRGTKICEEEIKKIAVLRAYLNEPRVVVDKFTGLKMIQHKEMREFKFD